VRRVSESRLCNRELIWAWLRWSGVERSLVAAPVESSLTMAAEPAAAEMAMRQEAGSGDAMGMRRR